MSNIILFCLSAINKFATIVDNKHSKSNIKLRIINTINFNTANNGYFDFDKLYTIWWCFALVFLYSFYSYSPPNIDKLKYPLLNFLIRVIRKLATNVDNKNRQSNI